MPREQGKSKRGPLYYSAYTKRNRLPPSQLALIIASHLRQNQPPIGPRGGPSMAEMPPPMNYAPLLSHSPQLDPPRAYSPDHFFGTGSCIVEEEIPPCWQETPLNVMAAVDEDDIVNAVDIMDVGYAAEASEEMNVEMMEDPPPSTPLRFTEEHIQLIFELQQKMDEHAISRTSWDNAWTS